MNRLRRIPSAALLILACLAQSLPLAAQAKKQAQPLAVPSDMLGSWAREEADCTDIESEARLHVTLKTLDFSDSKLTFSRLTPAAGGWLRVEGLSRENGKRGSRKVSLELRMKGADTLLLRNGPEQPESFVRCKPAQLQG